MATIHTDGNLEGQNHFSERYKTTRPPIRREHPFETRVPDKSPINLGIVIGEVKESLAAVQAAQVLQRSRSASTSDMVLIFHYFNG
jgi:hypothetical protein